MWWLKVSGRPSTYCSFHFVGMWWLMVTGRSLTYCNFQFVKVWWLMVTVRPLTQTRNLASLHLGVYRVPGEMLPGIT